MEVSRKDTMFGGIFRDAKVFVTGHTGFKGSWLCLWLNTLGAKVTGYALQPPTNPSMFELCRINELVTSIIGDVRDIEPLLKAMKQASPEIVIHMAAQPIVRDSYIGPVETYDINVMGTVNLLEAVRHVPGIKAVINVTTDKCYENRELEIGYREGEALGGYDPYSSSKACSELVTKAYRESYFSEKERNTHIASARAGNVIGGGDWAKDRIIPDCFRAIEAGRKITVRNPSAVRPWQHVLDCLSGYLRLTECLCSGEGFDFAEAWNFGPMGEETRPVSWIVERIVAAFPGAGWESEQKTQPHEAQYLKLDSSKALTRLGWKPRWQLKTALDKTIEWHNALRQGKDMREVTLAQIAEYASGELAGKHTICRT